MIYSKDALQRTIRLHFDQGDITREDASSMLASIDSQGLAHATITVMRRLVELGVAGGETVPATYGTHDDMHDYLPDC